MLKKLLIAALLCTSLSFAQRNRNRGGGDDSNGPPMPMASATKLDNIAGALNLSKDQKKAVKTILDDGAKEAAPLRDQISKGRIAVGEAIDAKKGEDELKQVARAESDLATQLAQLEMKTFAKIFGALDDNQKKDSHGLSQVLRVMNGIYRNKNWNED